MKFLLIPLISLCLIAVSIGQDPIFSQFYAAPIQLNPAFAGLTNSPNIAVNYRNQWPSLQQAYQTYAASYDQYFEYMNSGFGAMVLADDAGNGILKTNKFTGVYAYRLRMRSGHFVKLGVEASVVQSRLNWDKLIFLDQIDPVTGPVSPGGTPFPSTEIQPENFSNYYLDLGIGALYYSPEFYAGVTLKHLNTPDNTFLNVNDKLFSGLPLRMSIHLGSELRLLEGNNQFKAAFLSPGLMYTRQGSFSQLNIGTFVGMGTVSAGVWYRHANKTPDAVIVAVGFRKDFLRIGYSYDITVSRLTNSSGGSHELSILINLDRGVQESIYNDCFRIFR
jgi:type IX secretion system PorP/SprF family membrane protein